MKKRLFVAIDFPIDVKKQISQMAGELKKKYPQIRWERGENIHLTLKFLGWTEKEKQVEKGMENAVLGIKPFWFQLTKMGYFLNQSLIVWLGVESQEGLFKMAENLEEEMAKIGFPCEKREFNPHVTLGRRRQVQPISHWRQVALELQNFKTPQFKKFKVERVSLMESHLAPSGSIYTILKFQDLIF